jgi:DNA-binding NtrC family response regulator/pSer/pThr/pTyr-binding forkhead associated (FHA) protein
MAAPTINEPQVEATEARGRALYVVVMGPQASSLHRLPTSGEVLVGRAEDAPVRIVDPMASRMHARLHVQGDSVEIEDLQSANGTRVGDRSILPGTRHPLRPGHAAVIGATILVVQRRAPPEPPRKVATHAYFEVRLIEECARAESQRGAFAIARIDLPADAPTAHVEQILLAGLRPGDLLAAFGPREYEVLLVDSERTQCEALVANLAAELKRAAPTLGLRQGLAFYPSDGTSPQALVAHASAQVGQVGTARVSATATRGKAPSIVIESRAMKRLYEMAERAARSNINILILGETGVGKEVLGQAIHELSRRKQGPLVCINCAALPPTLLESELFGHEKGAFTGAVGTKEGLLEAASGGTVFLDEIGEVPLLLQTKLLRALEERKILRVGGVRPRDIDVRFIAATNRDIEEEIAAKTFREDLYYRLNGITLAIPPLRERAEEIRPLALALLEGLAEGLGRPTPHLGPDAIAALEAYSWPGNVRELRNVLERAMVLSSTGDISRVHLPVEKMEGALERPTPPTMPAVGATDRPSSSQDVRAGEQERRAILDALARCAGNQTRAAELLGMSRRTFCTRLREYNIPRPHGPTS